MTTESLAQLIDRLAIAQLKIWHYTQDGKTAAVKLAQEQVELLTAAIETYVWECQTGRRRPLIQHHLRYHDHRQVEAKQGQRALPATISGCILALVETHAAYWQAQTRIQELKRKIDRPTTRHQPSGVYTLMPTHDCARYEHELVALQRSEIDLANQFRNELITHLDSLFAAACSTTPPPTDLMQAVRS